MNNHTIVTAVFVLLLVFLLNPFGLLWMPDEFMYLVAASLAVVAAAFASLIMGEKARDEREEELRAHAARAGYLSGIFVLLLAIVVSVFQGEHVNEWIVITLAVMVLVRSFVRVKKE